VRAWTGGAHGDQGGDDEGGHTGSGRFHLAASLTLDAEGDFVRDADVDAAVEAYLNEGRGA